MGAFSIWHWLILIVVLGAMFSYIMQHRSLARAVNEKGGNLSDFQPILLIVPIVGFFWYFILNIKLRSAMIGIGRADLANGAWFVLAIAAGLFYMLTALWQGVGLPYSLAIYLAWLALGISHWFFLAKAAKAL